MFLPIAVGVWAIALGAFGGSVMSGFAEKCVTILGSTLIITAHGLNRTFCKYCESCTSDDDGPELATSCVKQSTS